MRRKALFQEGGLAIWGKIAKGTLRSSAFLGLYCTLCWRGACVGFQATKSCSPPVIAASAWTGAHSAFILLLVPWLCCTAVAISGLRAHT